MKRYTMVHGSEHSVLLQSQLFQNWSIDSIKSQSKFVCVEVDRLFLNFTLKQKVPNSQTTLKIIKLEYVHYKTLRLIIRLL